MGEPLACLSKRLWVSNVSTSNVQIALEKTFFWAVNGIIWKCNELCLYLSDLLSLYAQLKPLYSTSKLTFSTCAFDNSALFPRLVSCDSTFLAFKQQQFKTSLPISPPPEGVPHMCLYSFLTLALFKLLTYLLKWHNSMFTVNVCARLSSYSVHIVYFQ